MTEDDPHDHLAAWIKDSYPPAATTSQVHERVKKTDERVDGIIADFEEFRSHIALRIRQVVILSGVALATALAVVVIR